MSTSPIKTLSPAELAKLEHAFAADPSSEAYKPLAEAYLGMGRFMEAMVVCKKGVKAHPNAADPRLLLARVYLQQGKDKKALEEALGALQVQPADKQALRMVGMLQLKTGEAEPGKANLLKAWEADPNDAETLALLQQYKVEPPKPAAPPPAPVPVQAAPQPTAAPVQQAPAAGAPQAAPPVLAPVAQPTAAPPGRLSNPGVQAGRLSNPGVQARPIPTGTQPGVAAQPRPVPRRPVVVEEVDEDEDDEISPKRPAKAQGIHSMYVTLGLVVAIILGIGGFYGFSSWTRERNREFKKHIDVATEQLKHDSYDSYKKACEAADKALEVKPDSVIAHGYLAYAWAIRWGEHGGGDDARRKAEEHLKEAQEAARSGDEESSHLYAAEALVKTYGGKGKEALGEFEKRVKDLEAQGKASSLLNLTLGLALMNAGDLERARDSLDKAQQLAQTDPRIYASLGAVYRRLGQDNTAWTQYDNALRYEKDHPEALLGKSLLMMDQDSPSLEFYELAAKMLKKLLEVDPPPSPRQLATAQLARSLLISRVSAAMTDLKPEVQTKLSEATGVPVDKEKARAQMSKAEQDGFLLDKSNPELLLIKGRRLLAEGQTDAAVASIREAIKMDASRAQFHVELAKALMNKQGGEKEAAEALNTALKTMGESPKLVVMLGNALRRQGKLDEALAQYQRAVKEPKAKNPEARLAMGAIYRERSDFEKAQQQLEKAVEEFIGQADRSALALTELGRVYLSRGDMAKAEDAFQRAIQANGSHGPAYYFYATMLSKDRKQADKVRMLAQEYLKLEPKGEHAPELQRLASGG
ncbi:MAG: tetratricopeptide repeat protein [Myxococcaceae bacterium]|nr:tetratricopeptide repeat protein [Myxococcaceae bacterium]